jgi:hypothetical protein
VSEVTAGTGLFGIYTLKVRVVVALVVAATLRLMIRKLPVEVAPCQHAYWVTVEPVLHDVPSFLKAAATSDVVEAFTLYPNTAEVLPVKKVYVGTDVVP